MECLLEARQHAGECSDAALHLARQGMLGGVHLVLLLPTFGAACDGLYGVGDVLTENLGVDRAKKQLSLHGLHVPVVLRHLFATFRSGGARLRSLALFFRFLLPLLRQGVLLELLFCRLSLSLCVFQLLVFLD